MIKSFIIIYFLAPLFAFATQSAINANYTYEIISPEKIKSYIFGSNHSATSKIPINLGKCAEDQLKKSSFVYIEIDEFAIQKINVLSIKTVAMAQVADMMTQPKINFLSKIIYGNDAPNDIIKLRDLDAEIVLNYLQYKLPGQTEALGFPIDSLDAQIRKVSASYLKPIRFIESPEDQLSASNNVSPQDFAMAIEATMDLFANKQAADKYYEMALEALEAAATGDEKRLGELNLNSYEKTTIYGRNESLTNKILNIQRKTRASNFIALGALHLPGKNGVIHRLRESGFQIKRLCQ